MYFFFKQKTAYVVRIGDWSSDVCSSDRGGAARQQRQRRQLLLRERPLAAVALQQHARLGDVEGVVLLEAPGVEAGRQVVGEEVVAGEVEVDDAGEPLVTEEHVVGEEVGVDDARRQVLRPAAFQMIELGRQRAGERKSDG